MKIDLGAVTEADVAGFVESAFAVDFVFRSPKYNKSGILKEASDLLVIWDDVAIAIECKSQAGNADGSPRSEDRAWTRRTLRKAVNQLRGAVKTIKAGRLVNLHNQRRGAVEFSTSMFKFVYALVVINEESKPYMAADVVPETADFPGPIHVVSFRDFYNLCLTLDTPGDLVNYFEIRSQVLVPTFAPLVHDEQSVFAAFVDRFEELHSFRAGLSGSPRDESLFRESADVLRQIYRDDVNDELIARSYFVDEIVDAAHQVDPDVASNTSAYIEVATHLGRIVRSRRMYMAAEFFEAIERSRASGELAFAHFSSELRGECLLFFVSPRPRKERSERIADLRVYTSLLRLTRGVRRALGIATDPGRRSYDFHFIEGQPGMDEGFPDREEAIANGRILFGNVEPKRTTSRCASP